MLLGLKSVIKSSISSISRPSTTFDFPLSPSRTQIIFPKTQSRFPIIFAQNKNKNNNSSSSSSNNNEQIQEPNNNQEEQEQPNKNGSNGEVGNDDLRGNGRNPFLNMKLGDLILDPDPDNILAVGLTGLLAWASAQVLWQLFIVSVAILVAALKYSFIAALLVFILITLL